MPQDGFTALHEAAAWGKTKALLALLQGKADMEAQCKVEGVRVCVCVCGGGGGYEGVCVCVDGRVYD